MDVKFLKFITEDNRKVNRFQYTAIDDATRIRVLKIYKKHTQKNAIDFVDHVIEELPHTFTAAACTVENSEIYFIRGDVLRDIFKKNNHIGYKIMMKISSVISSRLRSLSQKFVNTL